MSDVIPALSKVGFSNEEARVYETTLQLGKASVTEIARKSGLKRTSIYQYVENLLNHNLLSKEIRGKRVIYIPQDPAKIVTQLEQQRIEFMETLPSLTELYSSVRHKPRVQFLENKNELRNAYLEISTQFTPIYTVFSVQDFLSVFSQKDLMLLNSNLEKNETSLYELIEDNPIGRFYMKSFTQGKQQTRLLPKKFSFRTDTIITGNSVLLVSFKNMMGIKIESDDIADFLKNMFLLVWENTKS